MKILSYVRDFMAREGIDYLLVNATNEFLVEYPLLEENSRYFLTDFTGDTGDALVTKDKLYLFVDGRFHEQADIESNKNTTVVKMPVGQTLFDALFEKIKTNKKIAIVSKKNSQYKYEMLKNILKVKNSKVVLLDFDCVEKFMNKSKIEEKSEIDQIPENIAGFTCEEKLFEIRKGLKLNEAYIFTDLEEISYLCNLRDFSQNYSTKIQGKCFVSCNEAILFTDKKIKSFSKSFKIMHLTEFESFLKTNYIILRYFVDKTSVNAFDYKVLGKKVKPIKNSPLKLMKSIKTDAEIAHLKECFARTDKAVEDTRKYFLENDNLSEYDICKKLEENFYKYGAKSLSFKSIVAADKNSALAHYSKNSKSAKIKDGSILLIDCGAYYEGGLATDCTRVFVKGNPTVEQKQIYTLVLKAHLKAYNKKISNLTTGFDIDKSARSLLNKLAPKGFSFSHGLGHGIGINVHEAPPNLSMGKIAKSKLHQNMCFTIEPGLYCAGKFGVRLENSCYLAKTEAEKFKIKTFSNLCFENSLIDYTMLTKTEKIELKEFEVK